MLSRFRGFLRKHSLLMTVLSLGLLVRIVFFTGTAYAGAGEAETAFRIAHALGESTPLAALRAEFGLGTLLTHAPLALIYVLGGVNDFTTSVLPLAISLLSIALVFSLAHKNGGLRVAFIAASLWALLPGEVLFATVFTPGRNLLVTLVLFGFHLLPLRRLDSDNIIQIWRGLLVIGALGLFVLFPAERIYSRVTELMMGQEWLVLLPLCLLSLLIRPDPKTQIPPQIVLAWMGIVEIFFYLLIWGQGLAANNLWLHPLALLGPILLAAFTLGQYIPDKGLAKYGVMFVAILSLCALLVHGFPRLSIPRYDSLEWLVAGRFETIFYILRGLGVLAIFAFAFSIARPRALHPRWISQTLVLGLAFSFLPVVTKQWQALESLDTRWQQAWSWVQINRPGSQLLVNSATHRTQLEYAAGFQTAADADGSQVRVGRLGLSWENRESGLAILTEEELWEQPIPETWLRLQTFGAPETSRLALFEILPAAVTCEDILAAAIKTPVPVALAPDSGLCRQNAIGENLADALISPNEKFRGSLNTGGDYFLIADLLVFQGGFLNTSLIVDQRGPDHWGIYQKYFLYPDGRTLDLHVILQPDSLYYFSGEFTTEKPVTALYYRVGDQEYAYGLVNSGEFQRATMIISTFGFDEPQEVTLSPVLARNHSQVELKDFQLVKIGP